MSRPDEIKTKIQAPVTAIPFDIRPRVMQTRTIAHVGGTLPKALTFQSAAPYSGLSGGTLRNYQKAGLITVYNVIIPGQTRGRKLIDRQSLDNLLEGNVGTVTTATICPTKGGNQ